MGKGVSGVKKNTEAKRHLLEARANADAILARGANRLLLIEAILIVCVFVALFISLESATALLLTTLTENELLSSLLPALTSLIYFVLGIFFAAPVVLGLFRLAERMQAGEDPVLLDLFYFLSNSRRYAQGLRATWLGSLKVVLMVLIVDTVNILCPLAWLGGILKALVILLFTLWMLFPYSKLYSRLRTTDKPARIGGGLRLVWFFLPWLLLGLVSIGLLLVLDVLPRMLLTYFCDCNREENEL